jgi:hypothetical protein
MERTAVQRDVEPVNDPQPVNVSHERPTLEAIAKEAYAIYLANGAEDGHDMDHWLEAERRMAEVQRTHGLHDDADLLHEDRDHQHSPTETQRPSRSTSIQ